MKESIDILCQVAVMAQKAVLVAQAIETLSPKEVEVEAEVE